MTRNYTIYKQRDKYDRYLRLVTWAYERYMIRNALTVQIGYTPTKFSRIEHAAFTKFLNA